jgi:signal transduction histidine kinase
MHSSPSLAPPITPFPKRGLVVRDADVLSRLTAHKLVGDAPRHELEWIAAHGQMRHYETGDVGMTPAEPVTELIILLSGVMAIYLDRGSGRRKMLEWRAGDVTGLLPYSRMVYSPGDSVIEEAADIFAVYRDHFPEMIRACPTVTATLVHTMLDRARYFTSTDMQDEKMMSLGRLSAGLAHELNNPASAAMRSAELLSYALADADKAAHTLGAVHLTDVQQAAVERLRTRCSGAPIVGVESPLERADREDAISAWLEKHSVDTGPASALADVGVGVGALDELAQSLSGATLDAAIRWIAAESATRALATEIRSATRRIHDLVSSIKSFTHMDRATVAEPANIGQGLADTITMLTSKARAKSVAVAVNIAPDLPQVRAYGGELNQVWVNLLENALDAAPASGHVSVTVVRENDHVVARVVDDGDGIPPDIQPRIFDPFFTTKPVGQGTGLGLDISRRIVRVHGGQIGFESQPGRTEFWVRLPAAESALPARIPA